MSLTKTLTVDVTQMDCDLNCPGTPRFFMLQSAIERALGSDKNGMEAQVTQSGFAVYHGDEEIALADFPTATRSQIAAFGRHEKLARFTFSANLDRAIDIPDQPEGAAQ